MLEGMGFPTVRCQRALLATGNSDGEAAMEWLFAHMDDPGGSLSPSLCRSKKAELKYSAQTLMPRSRLLPFREAAVALSPPPAPRTIKSLCLPTWAFLALRPARRSSKLYVFLPLKGRQGKPDD